MVHDKAIFIIPGFRQQARHKAYQEIVEFLASKDFFTIPVDIQWRKSTISQNTEDFVKKLTRIRAKKIYLLGFSYGAMIALLASTRVRVTGLILCSLSPFFKEDMSSLPKKSLSPLMIKRYEDFSGLHCATLAKKVKAKKVFMLYGAKESRPLIVRVTDAFQHLSSQEKHLIKIRGTEHEIGDKKYLQEIYNITVALL